MYAVEARKMAIARENAYQRMRDRQGVVMRQAERQARSEVLSTHATFQEALAAFRFDPSLGTVEAHPLLNALPTLEEFDAHPPSGDTPLFDADGIFHHSCFRQRSKQFQPLDSTQCSEHILNQAVHLKHVRHLK